MEILCHLVTFSKYDSLQETNLCVIWTMDILIGLNTFYLSIYFSYSLSTEKALPKRA